ncbi:GNAT family N-acetyltransferase [Bacillus sp. 1P06AnD]|uniref:GNAT family N-acetyltransferase n=1 Tax=Bacillus sp. 1P06AnD TaxID=3132208 RepID=UPI0039A2AF5C
MKKGSLEFRKTTDTDIEHVMEIIKQAQEYFKENNIDQWQDNYPTSQTIENDILNGNSYVLLDKGAVAATAVISFDEEPNYKRIYDGQWLSDGKCAVIHRLAVDNTLKGLGISSSIFQITEKMCLEKGINSIKVDTHEQNRSMQRLLEKNGYMYCGIIYVANGGKRVAFEKLF